MAQIIKLRRSALSGQKPTNSNLQLGELAINTTDGKVFLAKSGSLGPTIEELISTNTINTGSVSISGSIILEGNETITGSLTVTQGITGSLFGTSSWSNNSQTASYVTLAQTASYVLNAVSSSQAQNANTASYVQNAQTASYVTLSQTASYVLNAVSSSQAQNSNTASYVLNAQTASYVLNAQTASYVLNAVSSSQSQNSNTASYVLNAQTASYVTNAQTASYVLNAQTASYILNAVSSSQSQNANTASYVLNAVSSSYSSNADLLDNKDSTQFATTSSNTFIGNQIVTGSLYTTGSNTLIGTTTLTGSFNVSGSTLQVGDNTLYGTTALSGSVKISGSLGATTPTIEIWGDTKIHGYQQFEPVTTNINNNISSSYIYVSSSTNDLYFSQNSAGYTNTTRLRWLESNLSTGILNGGVLTSTGGTTTFTVSAGDGIIVNLNASTGSDPYPTVKQVNWPTQTLPIVNSGSAKITYVGVDSNGQIVQQTQAWGSTDITQWDTQINLGVVLHLSGSVSTGVFNSQQISYGHPQQADDFFRAFGPLKIAGHTLQASGSSPTLSIKKLGGTAFREGANYLINPNHPSTVIENDVNTSKIYRYYLSGTTQTPIINTNINNTGYTTIDNLQYYNTSTGALDTVGNGNWSIQRVFWIPNSPTNAFIVYYGNAKYATLLEAVNAKDSEQFTEAPNTALNGIFLGYIIIEGGAGRDLLNATEGTIIQGGLFRSVAGVGSSGTSPVATALAGLSDVSVPGRTTGDLLYYNGSQWINSKSLTGNYAITGSLGLTGVLTGNITGSLEGTSSYATSASQAQNSNTASYVQNAQTASFVTLAQTASYVLNAVSSSYSTSASQAQNANTSSYVLNAQTASFVTLAQTASYVLNAQTASFVTLAQTASYILNAVSSSQAQNANTASYVLNAQTASYILNAVSSSQSQNSNTASYVLNAQTASYVLNAQTSSFVTLAQSASYVLNAQTASYVLNAQTASFVTLAQTASYIAASGVTGLILSQIATGSVTASVNIDTNVFQVVTGSSTLLYLSSSGNLGIGRIPSSSFKLDVSGSIYASVGLNTNNYVGYFRQNNTLTGDTYKPTLAIHNFSDNVNNLNFLTFLQAYDTNNDGVTIGRIGTKLISGTGFGTSTGYRGDLLFQVRNFGNILTPLYIKHDGSIGVNTTTPLYTFDVSGSTRITTGLTASGSIYLPSLSGVSQTNVVGYDSATGQLYYQTTSSLTVTSASYATSASQAQNANTASYVLNAQTASFVTLAQTASYVLNAQTASYVLNAISSSQSQNSNTASYVTLSQTASYVLNAQTASYVLNAISSSQSQNSNTASFVTLAQTASYVLNAQTASYVLNSISSSYAATASSADTFIVRNDLSGSNARFTGDITAQTLYVQTVSSSVEYSSGSNIFGSISSNTHQFTGSVLVSNGITGSLFGTSSWSNNSVTASFITNAQTASYVLNAQTASYVLNSQTASYVQNAQTASYVTLAQTASYILNAISSSQSQNANTASYVLNAQTASFVTLAQTASYILNAVSSSQSQNANTASYVLNAQTASYVTLAQTASYVLNAVSSSFATSASRALNSNTASYVLNAQTSSYVLNAVSSSYPMAVTGKTLYFVNSGATGFNLTNSIVIGNDAGSYSSGAESSIFLGNFAGLQATNASFSIFIGEEAGSSAYDSNYSNFIGWWAGNFAFAATSSNFIGNRAGYNAWYANDSNFIGTGAGDTAFSANTSNFIGKYAGNQAINASYSNLIGYAAGSTGIGSNNIIIGTNVTLADNQRDSINIGGIIYGTGSYSTITGLPFSGSILTAKVGINNPNPLYNFDVSGSGNFTNGLTITGSVKLKSLSNTNQINVVGYDSSTGQLYYQTTSSLTVTSASYATSASQAQNANTASYVLNAQTASFVTLAQTASYVLNAVSSSQSQNANTASYVLNAQTASYVTLAQTASYILNAVSSSFSTSSSLSQNANTASYVLNAQTASYVLNAVSSSFATTASYALNASGVSGGTTNYIALWNGTTSLSSSGIYQSSSNIGIGTTSPSNLFEVNGISAVVNPFGAFTALQASGSTGYRWTLANDTSFRLQYTTNGFAGLAGTPMYVSSSGNVGIGTTTPTQKLEVDGDAIIRNTYIGYISAFGTNYASLSHTSRTGNTDYSFLSDNAGITYINAKTGQDIRFRINNIDKVIMDTNGNVGIGTTTPNSKLDINGNVNITGSLTVSSDITAQSLHVQIISSSVEYSSGSNIFGSLSTNTHQFTGSVLVSNGITGSLFGTSSWSNNSVTASFITLAQTASYVQNAQTASFVTLAQTASYVLNAQTASYVLNAVSSSFATTASYALNASGVSGGTINYVPLWNGTTSLTSSIIFQSSSNLIINGSGSLSIGTPTGLSATFNYSGNGYYNDGYSHNYRIYSYIDTPVGKVYSTSYTTLGSYIIDNGNSDSDYSISVSWTSVVGASGYLVLKDDSFNSWVYNAGVFVNTNSYTDNNTINDSDLNGVSYLPFDKYLNTVDLKGDLNITGSIKFNTDKLLTITNDNTIRIGGTGYSNDTYGIGQNTFLGFSSGYGANMAIHSNFIGAFTGINAKNAQFSNFIGLASGQYATNAIHSNFFSYYAGYGATNAAFSNFLGNTAGYTATDAGNSNFFGNQAGYLATNAFSSNFFGQQAGFSSTQGYGSNFLGYSAGYSATNAYTSNFIGWQAGNGSTYANNSNFIGNSAGFGATNAVKSNIIGFQAGAYSTHASSSNFIGTEAGWDSIYASYSNFIGHQTGYQAVSGAYSSLLGYQVGKKVTGTGIGRNNIIIGTNITLDTDRKDSINIGGIIFGTGSYFDIASSLPYSNTQGIGKIGINVVNPTYNFEVSGSVGFKNLSNTVNTNVVGYNSSTGQLSFQSTSSLSVATASYVLNAVSASYTVTSSYSEGFTISGSLTLGATLTDYAVINTSIVGSNNLFTKPTGSYTSAFFKYTATNGSNTRAGEVVSAWNGTTTSYYDNATVDIGNTNNVTASVSIVSGQVQFNFQTNTSGWRIKSMGTFI